MEIVVYAEKLITSKDKLKRLSKLNKTNTSGARIFYITNFISFVNTFINPKNIT